MMDDTKFNLGGCHTINRLGFGAMRLTGQPGNFGPFPDWGAGKALLRLAVESGVDHIDTARAYGPHCNEELIADALWPYNGLVIATKGGFEKTRNGGEIQIIANGTPAALRTHIDESRASLRLDCISLYYLHKPDPNVRFEDQIETLEQARRLGHIDMIGLSNVTLGEVQRALEIVPIAAVQNRCSINHTQDLELIEFARKKGIAYVAWGPLGALPQGYGAPLAAERKAADSLRALLAISPNILAIPGTTNREHLLENLEVC